MRRGPAEGGGIRSDTLPTFTQPVIEPRDDHVTAPRWTDLARNPVPILNSIQIAMEDFERDFAKFVDPPQDSRTIPTPRKTLRSSPTSFAASDLGRRAMRGDSRLEEAFKLANEVFARANADASFDTWRLFQIVYIVSHLPALAVRERTDTEMRRELDHVDVLWFPAGGGKTEAYLGLIIAALFYDRLRGKHAGVTSWLRFPLRMLSVQQLFRTLRVLVIAEDLRIERGVGSRHDDPFALGYLVGSGGTPNALKWPRGWWKGWEAESRLAAKGAFSEDHEEHRLVTRCPYCGRDEVVLALDTDTVRLAHQCAACGRELPLYMTDEEVYRYLPSVLISTVDKLTGYTWFPEFSAFSRGPRFRCPRHGYFSVPTQGTCTVGSEPLPTAEARAPGGAAGEGSGARTHHPG